MRQTILPTRSCAESYLLLVQSAFHPRSYYLSDSLRSFMAYVHPPPSPPLPILLIFLVFLIGRRARGLGCAGRGETCRSLDQKTGLYKGDRRRVGNKGGMEGGGCVSVGGKNHTHSPPPHTSTVDWVEDVGLEVTEEPDRQIFLPGEGG